MGESVREMSVQTENPETKNRPVQKISREKKEGKKRLRQRKGARVSAMKNAVL